MARPRIPLISKRRALEVALEIIDADGLAALSIRNLADHLRVTGASLYHHFENKEAIVLGAARLALEPARTPRREDEPWRAWLVRSAGCLRRVILDHPDLAWVFLRRRGRPDLDADRAEAAAALLAEERVPAGAIAPLLEALELYAVASALHEARAASLPVGPGEWPHLAEAVAARAVSAEEVFDLACERVIDAVLAAGGQPR